MPFEFLEEIATSDIAFKAWGKDLPETFIAGAEATLNVMVEELDSIRPQEERQLKLKNEALDMLLFDLLQELIYFKDAEKLLLRISQLKIKQGKQGHLLEGIAQGEKIDPDRHRMRVDLKAVTLHRFQLEKKDQGWEALVILDI
jgi:SHS2 domain-containing protein